MVIHRMLHLSNGTNDQRRYIGWAVLLAYALFLVWRALRHGEGPIADTPLWHLQDSHRLVGWMGGLVLAALWEGACFVPVGFTAALVAPGGRGGRRRLWSGALAVMIAGGLAALVYTVEIRGAWSLAAAVGFVLPLLGCLFGAWMGTTWRRGWRARLWFGPKALLLACLIALGAGAILWLSLEERPLPFEAAPVTSAEKRRLVDLVRSRNPRSLKEGQTHTLQLTEHDINVLLSWGLSLGSPERKAAIRLGRDSASLSVSMGVPLGNGKARYWNLQLTGGAAVHQGILSFELDRCRLGSLELPPRLLGGLGPVVISLLSHDRRSKPFLEATRVLTIEPDSIQATYGPLHLPEAFRKDLFGPAVASDEVLASTRAQVDRLLTLIRQSSPAPPDFGTFFETAFTLARDRSVDRDPVSENQAAIFALGLLLGHPRIEEFLGPILDDSAHQTARRVLARVALRERFDWTRHFCVSAVIVIFSDAVVSDAAGLLKEELDAGRGGSGFSFSDLLADRAGTTFAIKATCDAAAARAMQDRLADGFRVDEFFPPAADLPEGIPDAELQSRYGGVGGESYRRLIEEIERRVAACAAYR